jgi:hypothetical protein
MNVWSRIALVALIMLTACAQSEITPTARPPQILSYDLGEATIVQEHFPPDSPFREMPVRLEGVIGVPGDDEPHPVVLIMHGSHVICRTEDIWPCPRDQEQKNFEGFSYLVEALAEAGYVALSINVNAEHTFAFGEAPPTMRTTQLIDLHLNELSAANRGESDRFGVDLVRKVDLNKMTWLGHSRGGEFANWILRDNDLFGSTERPYGPVQGLILVAPSMISLDALPAADLATATILPACDQDVVDLAGQNYYESARLADERNSIATSVYLDGANHNHFNTVLEPERLDPPEDRPDCTADQLLSPSELQEFLVGYSRDFLETLYGPVELAADASRRLGLAVSEPVPTALYTCAVRLNTLAPSTSRLSIVQPRSDAELTRNLLGGDVTLDDLVAHYCPAGYYVPSEEPGSEPCKRVNFNQPGYPQQMVVSWASPGAEWRMGVPEEYADLSGYEAIQLRAAVDPLSDLNAEGEPQSFTVRLTDAEGGIAEAIISGIVYPAGVRRPNDFFEGGRFTGQVYMSAVRIPLADFAGIDLARLTEVALVFDQTATGTLFIADLELAAEGEPAP